MTVAIGQTNFGHAVDLLKRGFPALSAGALETSLARWMGSPGHRSGAEPIGYLLTGNGTYVGIGLTAVSELTSCTSGDDRPRRRVNLASWYIEPEHRLKLPVLLRRMLAEAHHRRRRRLDDGVRTTTRRPTDHMSCTIAGPR